MSRVTIEWEGQKELIARFEKMSKEMESQVKNSVTKHTYQMEGDAKKKAPYKTGHLQRSITSDFFNRGLSGRISTNVFYAPFMEYGTKPHKISAKTANALKFEVGGNTVFAKSVMHPGTKPMPFMFPAFLTARKDFIDDLQQIMDEVVEG